MLVASISGVMTMVINQQNTRGASIRRESTPSLLPSEVRAGSLAPRVFDYKSSREFLKDWLAWKKKEHPRYSGAVFAKKAGYSSAALLGMVIRGQRNLGLETIRAFSKALELRGKEATFFQNLVSFTQATSSEDKAYYLEQLHALKPSNSGEIVTKIRRHAQFLSRWYVVAIYTMVQIPGFDPSPEWIVKALKKKITKKEAEMAWTILLDLGLVTQVSETNAWTVVAPSVDIHPEGADYAIRNFQKDYLDRARESVDGDAMEDREISSFTIAVSQEDFERLKKKIKEFRISLNREFPISEGKREAVVAVNTQLLKLTNIEREKER